MFTSLDKALVALIMSALWLLNYFGIVPWTPTPEFTGQLQVVLSLATPLLVYFIPNKGMQQVTPGIQAKKMVLVFCLLGLGGGLSACAGNNPPPTQADQAALAEASLTAGETAWVGFLTFCNTAEATVKVCRDVSILQQGREYRQKAFAAVDNYHTVAHNTAEPAGAVATALADANAAISAFSTFANKLPQK